MSRSPATAKTSGTAFAAARLASEQSGVPHHLILAQAALESGWGQRQIRKENGEPSFNIFGVKANASWKGPTTEITTTEYENGAAVKIKAKFRVYSSYLEALSDYVGLLSRNPRYAAVTQAATPEQAQALQMRAMPPTRTMRVSSPA